MRFPAILMGDGRSVETLRLGRIPLIDADHSATTRPLMAVWERLANVMEQYGSVFRGSGPNSVTSSELWNEALIGIKSFVGVPRDEFTVIVGRNATDVLNRLARRLAFHADDAIFISDSEHSSNDLPWRRGAARIIRIPTNATGVTTPINLAECLDRSRTIGRRFLVTGGASNVTGAYAPYLELSRIAHQDGLVVVLDASQLVAHRKVVKDGTSHDAIPDAIAFAGHKMYAPFGAGFLVIRRELLEQLETDDVGGGTVAVVTADSYTASADEDRRELAGSPNFFGVVAAHLAGVYLQSAITFPAISEHAQALLDSLRDGLEGADGVQVFVPMEWSAERKSPLITFNVRGMSAYEVADRLACDYGIGIRAGHLCQFQLIERLLELGPQDCAEVRQRLANGEMVAEFGVARASFGIDNSPADCQRLAMALRELASRSRNRIAIRQHMSTSSAMELAYGACEAERP